MALTDAGADLLVSFVTNALFAIVFISGFLLMLRATPALYRRRRDADAADTLRTFVCPSGGGRQC